LSRAVRNAEGDWKKMYNVDTIIENTKNVNNTTYVKLSAEEINANDEDVVTPKGGAWIKKYHHFTYESAGVVKCKFVKGRGEYKRHTMQQEKGVFA
jgi:hypothetical protein